MDQLLCYPKLLMVFYFGIQMFPEAFLCYLISLLRKLKFNTYFFLYLCLTITGVEYKWSPEGCNQCKIFTAVPNHLCQMAMPRQVLKLPQITLQSQFKGFGRRMTLLESLPYMLEMRIRKSLK